MIKSLLNAFGGQAPVEETLDPPVAMAVLQIRLARADGHYGTEERALIHAELMRLCSLAEEEATQTLETADTLEAKAGDNVRFTKILKDAVDYEHRFGLVESLWKIALADGHRDFEEDGFMRLIANLLGVNDRDSALARQAAQKTLS